MLIGFVLGGAESEFVGFLLAHGLNETPISGRVVTRTEFLIVFHGCAIICRSQWITIGHRHSSYKRPTACALEARGTFHSRLLELIVLPAGFATPRGGSLRQLGQHSSGTANHGLRWCVSGPIFPAALATHEHTNK